MTASPITRVPPARREPTEAELDAFVKRLGRWLAEVASKPRRAA